MLCTPVKSHNYSRIVDIDNLVDYVFYFLEFLFADLIKILLTEICHSRRVNVRAGIGFSLPRIPSLCTPWWMYAHHSIVHNIVHQVVNGIKKNTHTIIYGTDLFNASKLSGSAFSFVGPQKIYLLLTIRKLFESIYASCFISSINVK